MGVTPTTKLLLAFRSGNICVKTGCERTLAYEDEENEILSNVGEAAHIEGEKGNGKKKSARYNSDMTDDERNHYNNLIFLCKECHKVIDDNESVYTVEKLKIMKKEHEQKVRHAIIEAFADIGFPELELATKWIKLIQPALSTEDYSIIPPEEKIKKNELTHESRVTISMGLGVAKEVHSFVESEASYDINFPERLKAGFLEEYFRLWREGHKGDVLFDLMCQYAQRGMVGQAKKSAGLAVLIYLFERCEVFEK